jgi:hypothetical protein
MGEANKIAFGKNFRSMTEFHPEKQVGKVVFSIFEKWEK